MRRFALRAAVVTLVVVGVACGSDLETNCTQPQAVIGGQASLLGQFPATGALMIDGQFMCTGTLIAPDVVLTAAHCVSPDVLGDYMPGFTLALDANRATPDQIHPGQAKHAHPEFTFEGPGIHDIGLLLLEQPFDDVAVAVLPSPSEGARLVVDSPVDIAGYGMATVDAMEAGIKHHATTHVAAVTVGTLLIAHPGEPQNCRGDSGGPAYFDAGAGPRIVGVVSGGDEPCVQGGYDTRVDHYLDWIDGLIDLPCGGTGTRCPEPEPEPQPACT